MHLLSASRSQFPLPGAKNKDYLDSLTTHLRTHSSTPLSAFLADLAKPFMELGIRYLQQNFLAVQKEVGF
jgi:hypothetical protein